MEAPEQHLRCEIWDTRPPSLPVRSRLYHLQPIGVGTESVESLSSYTSRLALAHSVYTGHLVRYELVGLSGPMKGRDLSKAGIDPVHVRSMNGSGSVAAEWVDVLQAETLRRDLGFLTLRTWRDTLSYSGPVGGERAWCPGCYEEQQKGGQEIYDPLLWTVALVTFCPKHRRRLSTRCPSHGCGPFPMLSHRSRPGYCPRCSGWLGVSPENELAAEDAVDPPALAWQTWVVKAIGKLFAAAPHLKKPPVRGTFSRVISGIFTRPDIVNIEALAHKLSLSAPTIHMWLRDERLPKLHTLMYFCNQIGAWPHEVLTRELGDIEIRSTPFVPEAKPPVRRRNERRLFDTVQQDKVRAALEEAAAESPPPSLKEVSARVGWTTAYLYAHFNDLCLIHTVRYKAYMHERSNERIRRLQEEVERVTRELHENGTYPNRKLVDQRLSKPGKMLSPEARIAWRRTLHELGYRDGNAAQL
jgi:hypothetical protein